MIRAIAFAAMLGALVASVAAYTLRPLGWWKGNTPLFAALDRGAKTTTKPEDWPICTTMALVASDAEWAQLDPDFKAGKKALGAEDWNGAIAAFELAALRDPLNADIQNYIGYAHRRLRQLGPAIGHYQQALILNPRHRSAHEHLGEAYLVLGESAKAEQLLAALGNLCLLPCEEYDDLKRALAAYKKLAAR
ncbi:tetratricopeptide repeat protein [Bradyrhizobium erythrophlei]|jgi:tetratricopeptide (TPR) repeat protein|uniref:Tetratricopeptide repeat-containing protein n=1 Tax=Bradyrhizobium erythrophlei TaxID=1437360 RepID=A0A1M7U151_9BRAD|nr:tetratricopeptide repeat protein [Bradyrhizobium erythrophlei]SHN76751.1 Tetratricopeptide repeat-containing protein [Bradyrhizobium erythrophlei]